MSCVQAAVKELCLPDRTTTIGELDADTTERPFHSIKAVERTSAKFSTCAIDCRAFVMLEEREDSMVGGS